MAGAFSIPTFLAVLATAPNAGLFFIFSVCIMAAFFGGALLSLALAVLGFLQGGPAATAGALVSAP